jgi:phosphate-selective porin OprO/OprP
MIVTRSVRRYSLRVHQGFIGNMRATTASLLALYFFGAVHGVALADTVSLGAKGLSLRSSDGANEFSLRGYGQYQLRQFNDDSADAPKDGFMARRLRPIVQMRSHGLSMRFMPEISTQPDKIMDAHVDYQFDPLFQVRLGKFKPPVSLERLQSASDLMFIERAFPTNFAPSRDVGVQLYGELPDELMEYQVGVFEGDEDLGTLHSNVDAHKDVYFRVFGRPFNTSGTLLKDLHLGVGSSIGTHQGTPLHPLTPRYRSYGQQTIFRYANNVLAEGTQWRLYPQAMLYHDNFGILGEYAITSHGVSNGVAEATMTHHAWQLEGAYVLTGEKVDFKGGVSPQQAFDPMRGGWGAFEGVARVSGIHFDHDAFAGYARSSTSVSSAMAYGVGLNWYLNATFKLATNIDLTHYEGGGAGGRDRADERAWFTQAQIRF